ncbi:MAG: MFS transporter [Propioniciclava sp.]|uniref:MFS transporter n=1 Tax=Propioniciclava sp. TaxID=2038686 RepID=UPI0039E4D703
MSANTDTTAPAGARQPWLRVAAALAMAAWGANQFVPMLLVYRAERGLPETLVTAMFAAYVLGMVPTLLGGAWFSQRHGRRLMVRISVVLMAVASLLLLAGADVPALLFAGRIVAGAGVGFAMGAGSAWVSALSSDRPAGTGARRAALAMTAGFGLGPILAGALAQWVPAPLQLPYAVHLVLQTLAAVAVWNAPEPRPETTALLRLGAVAETVRHQWFWTIVLPSAPWVFGTVAVAFAVVPSVTGPLPGLPVVFAAGAAAGIALGTSALVQPLLRRWASGHAATLILIGMGTVALGMLMAMASALWPASWWLPVIAVVLGSCHALLIVGCMTLVELNSPPGLLAPMTAIVYCLAYIGFTAPWVVALLALVVPAWVALLVGAVVAVATTAWLVRCRRRG